MPSFDPVVAFFLLGILASIAKSGLRVPKDFYDTLSIYLLLAIGIKGGIDLVKVDLNTFLVPACGVLVLSTALTFIAFAILRKVGNLERHDAVSIASHYGSVSIVTFAVAVHYLQTIDVHFEEFSTVLLVLFEVTGVIAGVLLSHLTSTKSGSGILAVVQEVLLGKGVLLLIGGLLIGCLSALSGNTQIHVFFIDLFKGFLALFMLEMGVLTSQKLGDLRKLGPFLIVFGVGMPLAAGVLGCITGILINLSLGGITLLATMSASASYIAAPAAMKMAEPKANPTLSMAASLGITFPFNILIGIPIYHHAARWLLGILG